MLRALSKTFISQHSAFSFASKAAAQKKLPVGVAKQLNTTHTNKPKPAAAKKAPAKSKASPKKKTPGAASKAKSKKAKEESKTPHYIMKEKTFSTNNYSPLEVVITKARGLYMTDVDGKRYMDFLAAYSAVNQGHNHPKILSAMRKQIAKLNVVSKGFYHDLLA